MFSFLQYFVNGDKEMCDMTLANFFSHLFEPWKSLTSSQKAFGYVLLNTCSYELRI